MHSLRFHAKRYGSEEFVSAASSLFYECALFQALWVQPAELFVFLWLQLGLRAELHTGKKRPGA
ncbi:hypothetical protein ACLS0R_12040 [Comamonas jiangduensis]|uniref:hypothetical protein n=1 Tax=Comamonas jiangduensis TaxID=1194168 RepID=UPI003BF89A5C